MHDEKLDRKTLFCYSFGNVGLWSIWVCTSIYLFYFYTETIKLSPLYVSYALAIAMLFDAVSDPIMGYISDNSQWRYGRRRPFFLIGSIPAGICFYFAMSPPEFTGENAQWSLFLYLTITMTLLRTFFTIFETPYGALAPELTYDYDERTPLSAYRRFMDTCGEILGFALPAFIVGVLPSIIWGMELTTRNKYSIVGAILGFAAIVCGAVAFWGTWERQSTEKKADYSFFAGLKETLKNKPFAILLMTFTVTTISDRIISSQMLYIFTHFYHKQLGDMIILMVFYSLGALSLPYWLRLSYKIGKKHCYMLAMLFYPITLSVIAVEKWSDPIFYSCMFLMGIGTAGIYAMPLAILPDIIEWDQLRTNQRREGSYMGLVTFVIKLGMGFGLIVLGVILYSIGYKEDTYKFSLQGAHIQNLDRQILAPELRKEFDDKSKDFAEVDPLSPKIEIIQLQEKQIWLLKDLSAKKSYILRRELEEIKLYTCLLSIDQKYQEYLKADQKVAGEIAEFFKKIDQPLAEDASISLEYKDTRWSLRSLKGDEFYLYMIIKEGNRLNIYNYTQTPRTVELLRYSYACIPIVLLIIAAWILSYFPITKEKYQEMLDELNKRRAEKT